MQVQAELEHAVQTKMDSVLLSNSKKECYSSVNENSINVSIKNSTLLNNLSDNELLKCQTSSDNIDVYQKKSLEKSSSYSDIRLPLDNVIAPVVSNECEDLKLLCNDEEETLFTTDSCVNDHEPKLPELKTSEVQNVVETGERVISNSNLDIKLVESNDEMEVPTNVTECKGYYNNEKPKSSCSIKNSRSQNNVIVRPSFIDDSKLVKISLPTNPISIMQSNTQFLNKSRNFLNFITEKSTNIMEKALLPQHLTVKYNSMMKSVDNSYSEKKCAEDSCSTKSSSTELMFGNDSRLVIEKAKGVSCPLQSPMNVQCERNECTVNCEDKSAFTLELESGESTSINVEKNDKDSLYDCKLIDSKQIESHIVNDDTGKISNNVLGTEASGNSNESINSMVLKSEVKDGFSLHDNSSNSNHQTQEQISEFETSKHSLLNHPTYLTLLKDYADLKARYLKCEEKLEYLEERNRALEIECKKEIHSVQIQNLEKIINRLTSELHTTLTAQEVLKKEYSAANKERESMVMKYAFSEKQLIETQRYINVFIRKYINFIIYYLLFIIEIVYQP